MRVGPQRKLSAKELPLSNCGVGKTLESLLDSREIKPVNPKEISPEYSLEGLMLKLKLQYFGHLMGRADSLEKTLMLGKLKAGGEGGDRWLDGTTDSMHMSLSTLCDMGKDREACHTAGHEAAELATTELLNNKCSYLT